MGPKISTARSNERPNDRTTDRPTDRPNARTSERSNDRAPFVTISPADSSQLALKAPKILSEWQTSHRLSPAPSHLGPFAAQLDRGEPWQTSHRTLRRSALIAGTIEGTRSECTERSKHLLRYGQVSTEPTFAKQKPVRRSPAPQLCSTRSVHTPSCKSNY